MMVGGSRRGNGVAAAAANRVSPSRNRACETGKQVFRFCSWSAEVVSAETEGGGGWRTSRDVSGGRRCPEARTGSGARTAAKFRREKGRFGRKTGEGLAEPIPILRASIGCLLPRGTSRSQVRSIGVGGERRCCGEGERRSSVMVSAQNRAPTRSRSHRASAGVLDGDERREGVEWVTVRAEDDEARAGGGRERPRWLLELKQLPDAKQSRRSRGYSWGSPMACGSWTGVETATRGRRRSEEVVGGGVAVDRRSLQGRPRERI